MRRLAAPLAAVALLAGCGTSDEEAVTTTVEGYFDDLSARDWRGACEALAPSYLEEVTAFAQRAYPGLRDRSCTAVLARTAQDADGRLVGAQGRLEVGEVTVDGDRATAGIGPERLARLERRDGAWRITALDLGG